MWSYIEHCYTQCNIVINCHVLILYSTKSLYIPASCNGNWPLCSILHAVPWMSPALECAIAEHHVALICVGVVHMEVIACVSGKKGEYVVR